MVVCGVNSNKPLTNIHRRAPFVYDAWRSPQVLAKVSEVAGIDLIPAWEYEIANINISVKDDNEPEVPVEGFKHANDDETPAFGWHFDSFPFVCVTMLSDCTRMIGGETAIQLPSGDIKKFRGPAMVLLPIKPPGLAMG